MPLASAQLSIGVPANHKSLEITIDENGSAHVVHEIQNNRSPQQLNVVDGTVSNLTVVSADGNDVEYGEVGLETLTGITVFPTSEDVIIEYDLDDVIAVIDGVSQWNYRYLESSTFFFPENVNLVFVNDRPVNLGEIDNITCHGCQMTLEYVINEPQIIQEVNWEQQDFKVGIQTLAEITSFNFEQPRKSISFNVNEDNRLITLFIPLELLWNPYEVYLNDEKLFKHEFFTNETHVWLNIRPETPGTIEIIGTSVVPEFSAITAIMLFGITAVIIMQYKNRFSLR